MKAQQTVEISDDVKGVFGIAKVSMGNGNAKVEMKSTEEVFQIKREALPDYFPYQEKKAIQCHVTMNDKGDKMMYAMPAHGEWESKFLFIGQEHEKPVAKVNQYGSSFGVVLEITQTGWKGARMVKWFNLQEPKEGYKSYCRFGKDEDGNLTIDGYGTKCEEMIEFFHAVGIWETNIKYSENPLPDIQKAIQDAGKMFISVVSLNTKSNYMDVNIQEPLSFDLGEDGGVFELDEIPDHDYAHPLLNE